MSRAVKIKFKISHEKLFAGTIILAVILAIAVYYWFFVRVSLSHEQKVWLAALEWCESRGVKTAVNPKDLDGTPSYFSFQFKPETFKRYGIKYGIFPPDVTDEEIKAKLDDYPLQKKIVSFMIDDPKINWRREFPDCVRRLGKPPADPKS